MAAIFKFRVTIDHEETIYREIEIQSNQHFHNFSHAIIDAFNLMEYGAITFLKSDNNWHEGQEIMQIKDNEIKKSIDGPNERF